MKCEINLLLSSRRVLIVDGLIMTRLKSKLLQPWEVMFFRYMIPLFASLKNKYFLEVWYFPQIVVLAPKNMASSIFIKYVNNRTKKITQNYYSQS